MEISRKASLAAPFALLAVLATAACPSGSHPTIVGPTPPTPPDPDQATTEEILAASDLPELLPAPLADDAMGVTIHRLSNGITVYISTDRQKPRFDAWIAIRAGSRNDPSNSTGLAHYLEHMLFKGTEKMGTTNFGAEKKHLDAIANLYDQLRKTEDGAARAAILKSIDDETQKSSAYAIPNELDQLYAAIGIQGVNAFTSNDETVYIANVPQNELHRWAAIEGDRFDNAQFRLFYPELESVYEEKNRTLDSPDSRMYEQLMVALFPDHPYGTQPTIGTVDHLKTPAYGDMAAYYERWYVPNNMAILLSGDIDAHRALPALEKAFAGMKPRPLSSPEPAKLTELSGRVESTVEAPGEQSLMMAWKTAAAGDRDAQALEVMDLIVDNSASGLINLDLVLTQKLPAAGSGPVFHAESGLWYMRATARDGQTLEEVEALLLGVVDKLKRGEFSDKDLAAIILNTEISEKQQLESTGTRVQRMADSYISRIPWKDAHKRIDRMRQVTKEDVVRVANKYLSDNFAVVRRKRGTYEPPKIPKPTITPIPLATDRESQLAAEIRAMKVAALEPEWLVEGEHYQRLKLPAGDLITTKNTRNDLFAVDYWFDIGSHQQKLLCHALELLDRAGAGKTSPEALKREMYAMGISISTRCGDREASIHVSGVDRNLEASVAMVDRWLRTAAFEADTVTQLATNTISLRKDEMAEPQSIASALYQYVARGKDSPYLSVASNKQIKAASGKVLGALLAAFPDHQHRTSYFGPREAAEVAKVVALGKKHKRVKSPSARRYRESKGTRIFTVKQSVAQSQVRLAFPGEPLTDTDNTDEALSRIYSEYVGGNMGALVYQEIREARGLAYRAWAVHSRGDRKGDQPAIIGGLGTQSDKTLEAIQTLVDLLRNIPSQNQRFENTRDSLDREFRASRVNPRSAPQWVFSWDDLGETSDPRPRIWKQLAQLKVEDLAQFATRASKGATLISILGDTGRFDQKQLGKLGTVEEVSIKQLFGY